MLFIILSFPVLATLMPFLSLNHWSVRIFDFPRLQLACLGVASAMVALLQNGMWFKGIAVLNVIAVAYQLWEIVAYTPLMRPKVKRYQGKEDERTISILVCNVLTPNRQTHKLLAQITQYQPDIVLTLESDDWWQQQLSVLEQDYSHCVSIPLDNLYGMHLYSRLPLRNTQILYRVQADIPSIYTQTQLRSGDWIDLHCLHPMPPSPTESTTSTNRDAELLLVGQEVAQTHRPALVFGDLNDVAWSLTSRLFQKISGLLDPRMGRGLYNTFHAKIPLLRWPLDHIFHSNHFMMRQIEVLPEVGSDHFPIYGQFQYHPLAEYIQEQPAPEQVDQEKAQDKIDEALQD